MRTECRFKVGDRVRILDGRYTPGYDDPGGPLFWDPRMDPMIGKVLSISSASSTEDGNWYLISGWGFLEESLEPENPTRGDWVNRTKRRGKK